MSDGSRATLGFMAELFGALGDLFVGTGTWAESTARRYSRFLLRAAKVFAITAFALVGLMVFGVTTGVREVLPLVTLLVGASTALFLLLASPIGALALKLGTEVEAVNRFVKLVSAIMLWAALLSLYFYIVPVSSRPAGVFVVLLITFIIALLWATFGVGPNPRRIYASVVSIFILTTAGFFFPQTFSAMIGFRGAIDETIAKCLSKPSACISEAAPQQLLQPPERRPSGPQLRPDGTVPHGERIALRPGDERSFFFQKEGVRFLGKGGRVRVISASNSPTLTDKGQSKISVTIDVDRDTRESPPWITCPDICGLRFIAETAIVLEARSRD